jgi:hypothetical protein
LHLPTRLIDTQSIGSSSGIRLVSTHNLDFNLNPVYCTLSHCWGKRTSNSSELAQEILLDALPQTFRDAVYMSRHLGVRYLWIDSLCVIQDSLEDWRKESVTMHQIYSGAVFNIAATHATSSVEGLFSRRIPRHRESPVHASWSKVAATYGEREVRPGVYTVKEDRYGDYAIQDLIDRSPLNSRAWVYQERLLSKKTLHFTASEVFFECKVGIFSEYAPDRSWPHDSEGRAQLQHAMALPEICDGTCVDHSSPAQKKLH